MGESVKARVDCLDGLRGLAALWVLIGHAMILTGWRKPVIGEPDLGVDLFIMLSGFLMVFHFQLRAKKEPWEDYGTWMKFWARRYFRIAPLFYVALALAMLMGPIVYANRLLVDTALHMPIQQPERYLDAGPVNILAHLSFVFGLLPDYAFRTALPDWSLGLEMQFYAVFPVVMLFICRFGWIASAVALAVSGMIIAAALDAAGIVFPMPSFLPLKMHIFLCGMLLAGSIGKPRMVALCHFVLALALALIPVGGAHGLGRMAARDATVMLFFALVLHDQLPRALVGAAGAVSRTLGSPVFHWLGELSFGAYLFHLLILTPITGMLIGAGHAPATRFALSLAITLPLVYGLSFVTYSCVERPGQKIGRHLILRRLDRNKDLNSDPAEIIAAP